MRMGLPMCSRVSGYIYLYVHFNFRCQIILFDSMFHVLLLKRKTKKKRKKKRVTQKYIYREMAFDISWSTHSGNMTFQTEYHTDLHIANHVGNRWHSHIACLLKKIKFLTKLLGKMRKYVCSLVSCRVQPATPMKIWLYTPWNSVHDQTYFFLAIILKMTIYPILAPECVRWNHGVIKLEPYVRLRLSCTDHHQQWFLITLTRNDEADDIILPYRLISNQCWCTQEVYL